MQVDVEEPIARNHPPAAHVGMHLAADVKIGIAVEYPLESREGVFHTEYLSGWVTDAGTAAVSSFFHLMAFLTQVYAVAMVQSFPVFLS